MTAIATQSTKSQVIMAHVFCVSTQFTAVVVYVLGKQLLATLSVHSFVFLRLLFVVPITAAAAVFLTRTRAAWKVTRKTFLFLLLSAIIGVLISQSLVFGGLARSTATNTSIISAPCTPLFTSLLSVLRGTDKMNVPKGLGFLSSVVGALLLLQVWNFEFEGTTLGNLLIVCSSICSALNAQIQKYILNQGLHPLVAQSYICALGTVSFMGGYAGFGLFSPSAWDLTPKLWLYISIIGVVATAVPWCVGMVALKHTSPMTTSVYTVLQPLIAVFVGVIIMGEVLTWVQFIGGGLVLLGLVLVQATPLVKHLYQQIQNRRRGKFLPLTTEDEGKHLELSVLAGEKDEVKYELAQVGETNDFVIADGADVVEVKLHPTPRTGITFTIGEAGESDASSPLFPTSPLIRMDKMIASGHTMDEVATEREIAVFVSTLRPVV